MSDNLLAKDSKSLFTKEEEEEEAMWDFLPPEILPIILLRLPTKSIVKDAMFNMKTHSSAQITNPPPHKIENSHLCPNTPNK